MGVHCPTCTCQPEPVDARLMGGPYDGRTIGLERTPRQVIINGRHRYDRVDDPDTGQYLGAYVAHQEGSDG